MIVNRVIGGNGGETASIFVTGLHETDTVTATKDGKTYSGKWWSKPNTAYIIPDGYTQLEYIESTGTQYIPCGLTSYTNLHVEIEFEHYTKTNDYWTFGNFIPYSTNYRRLGYYNNGYDASHNSTWTLSQTDFSTRTHAETTMSGTYSYEMNMFSMMDYNTGNVNYHAASGRIYYLKMWSEDNLIRDFIPCKRSTDNTIGMYDLVTNTFYTNSGTGAFTAGAEVPQIIDGFLIDNIKSYGTYTITATDGTNTTTQDVLVDMAIQFDVEMSYFNGLKLYWLGDECEDVTGGWSAGWSYGGGGAVSLNNDNFTVYAAYGQNAKALETNSKVSISGYTKLKAEVIPIDCSSENGNPNTFWLYAIDTRGTWDEINKCTFASHITYPSEGFSTAQKRYENLSLNESVIIEYDISSLSGSKYIGCASYGGNTWKVSRVWLE